MALIIRYIDKVVGGCLSHYKSLVSLALLETRYSRLLQTTLGRVAAGLIRVTRHKIHRHLLFSSLYLKVCTQDQTVPEYSSMLQPERSG